jgi:putative dehydrogenase
VECSTLPIKVKARGRAQLTAQDKVLLDCPVSGTGAQAASKDLVVFASGVEAAFERCLAVLAGISRAQKYVGAFGNGSRMKFIANPLVTIHNLSTAEAFVLGEMAGLDPALIFDVIADSAGSSRMFQIRGPMMVAAQYDKPTATMKTHLKDIGVIGKFAADLHCPTPLFTAAAQFYHAGVAQGRDRQDTAAVCAMLEKFAGIERKGSCCVTAIIYSFCLRSVRQQPTYRAHQRYAHVMPAHGSAQRAARGQAEPALDEAWGAGIHDFSSCSRQRRGWPAYAGHDGG